MAQVTFDIKHLTRVEGHGNLLVELRKGAEPRIEMQVTEGTRLFEAFLRGQYYDEVSHIMSRICGICSHSHAVAALRGVEAAMRIQPTWDTVALRKLMLINKVQNWFGKSCFVVFKKKPRKNIIDLDHNIYHSQGRNSKKDIYKQQDEEQLDLKGWL